MEPSLILFFIIHQLQLDIFAYCGIRCEFEHVPRIIIFTLSGIVCRYDYKSVMCNNYMQRLGERDVISLLLDFHMNLPTFFFSLVFFAFRFSLL